MHILVTGASGFIGQALLPRLLADGHRVRALARRPPEGAAPAGLEWARGDMEDAASLDAASQGVDAVVHLACATGVADERLVRRVNVDGTKALLEASRRHGVRRFVFVSTISATRDRMGPYGRTKKEGEALVADSGLEWVTLRPSLVYGSSSIGLFATLTAYLKKLPVVPVIGNGRIELDPIHVDDVVDVIGQCLTRNDVLGRSYDLLGPERVTFNDFLGRVSRRLGVRKPVVHIPGPVAMLMAGTLGMVSKRPPVSVDNVLGMISPARVDRAPAARDFPRRWITLDEGLKNGRVEVPFAASSPVPVAPLLASTPRPLKPVRVAVIGLGKMGVAHTAVLSTIPDCEVVGFADHHAPLGKSVRGMGYQVPFFRSAEKLLARLKPDAVFVCTQQFAHEPITRLALDAGAAVFVEKPLAHTLAAAEAMVAHAAQRGLPLGCGYTLAYLPVFATAQHAIERGALGTLRQARSSMYISQVFGPRKGWMYDQSRSGGGVVANISSHLLFLLEWMLGTPVEVEAKASRIYGAVEDELHGMMRLASGATVGFESSWSVPGYPLSAVVIEVEGSNGKMLVSNDAIELDLLDSAGGFAAGHTIVRHPELPQPARFDVNGEGYYLEDAAFLAWVTGGPTPPTTGAAALRVQRVMDALYRSAADGGKRVTVAG